MLYEEKIIETIPVGPLGLIPLKGCEELVGKVDKYLVDWRNERESEHKTYDRIFRLSERLLHHRGKHTEIWFRRGKGRDQGVGAWR